MDIRRKLIPTVMLAAVAGCETPTMDTASPDFSQISYLMDVGLCGGSATVTTAVYGIGGAVAGSAFGALHGAVNGSAAGDAEEGVIIGAIAGGVVGFGLEATKAIDEGKKKNERCLTDKGYSFAQR